MSKLRLKKKSAPPQAAQAKITGFFSKQTTDKAQFNLFEDKEDASIRTVLENVTNKVDCMEETNSKALLLSPVFTKLRR